MSYLQYKNVAWMKRADIVYCAHWKRAASIAGVLPDQSDLETEVIS